MKKKDLIIVIIFISFLVLPSILFWFVKDKFDNTNYENRTLSSKPEFTFKDITKYPESYENYFNDHLPFKNQIRKVKSSIYYNVLGISTTPRVIIGDDGWMFYTGELSMQDFRKIEKCTEEDEAQLTKSLQEVKKELFNKNIEYYVMIPPNKETIYSDRLVSKVNRVEENDSRIDDLVKYIRSNSDIEVIYPKDELLKSRTNSETYYKYDTHWNNYGSFVGINEMMKTIDSNYKVPEYKIETEEHAGDLAKMNLMPKKMNVEPKITGFYDDVKYECTTIGKYDICNSDKPVYDKTMLFVGDSFRVVSMQYLAKLYKTSIFVHRSEYEVDLISKYNPDIVVYQAVERLFKCDMDVKGIINIKD